METLEPAEGEKQRRQEEETRGKLEADQARRQREAAEAGRKSREQEEARSAERQQQEAEQALQAMLQARRQAEEARQKREAEIAEWERKRKLAEEQELIQKEEARRNAERRDIEHVRGIAEAQRRLEEEERQKRELAEEEEEERRASERVENYLREATARLQRENQQRAMERGGKDVVFICVLIGIASLMGGGLGWVLSLYPAKLPGVVVGALIGGPLFLILGAYGMKSDGRTPDVDTCGCGLFMGCVLGGIICWFYPPGFLTQFITWVPSSVQCTLFGAVLFAALAIIGVIRVLSKGD